MYRMLIIYNPHAGKAHFKTKLADVVDYYTQNGYLVTVRPTLCAKDATNIITECAPSHDVVVVSGGDGTLSEVVHGMMSSRSHLPIGYIPSGTTNDFSSSLHLSSDIMTAAKTVIEGRQFACDVGMFNGRAFSYIAAFGLFTEVSYQTPQDMKNILGRMAYILEGAKSLTNIPSFEVTVTTETETFTDEFIYGMVSNALSVGGFKAITDEGIALDDGLFEVILARKPQNRSEIHSLLQCVLTRNFNSPHFYVAKTANIAFHANTPIQWSLDGECSDVVSDVVVQNNKQAMRIFVPIRPHG